MPARSKPHSAFINVPFDAAYEPLYLALIAGLCGFGLVPRSVLNIPGSQRRLDRILKLIQSCAFSFHDLSRVELSRSRPRTPRFNMPFELGVAVTWANLGDRRHAWYALESKRHRALKSISDLNGTEIYVHGGTPIGVLRQLANALVRTKHKPTVPQLKAIYRDVQKKAALVKADVASSGLFEAHAFRELVLAANISARGRVPSLLIRHNARSAASQK